MKYLALIALIVPFLVLLTVVLYILRSKRKYSLTKHAYRRMQQRYDMEFTKFSQAQKFIRQLITHQIHQKEYYYNTPKDTKKCVMLVCKNPKNQMFYKLIINQEKRIVITVLNPVKRGNSKQLPHTGKNTNFTKEGKLSDFETPD